GAAATNKFAQKRFKFNALPGPDTRAADKHYRGVNAGDLLFESTLPWQAWAKLPCIEPGDDPSLEKATANLFDNFPVFRIVAEEGVKVPAGTYVGGLGGSRFNATDTSGVCIFVFVT